MAAVYARLKACFTAVTSMHVPSPGDSGPIRAFTQHSACGFVLGYRLPAPKGLVLSDHCACRKSVYFY